MKKLFYLLMMSFLAAFSSCKKDERIVDPLRLNSEASACGVKDPVNNLKWLKKIIQEAKKDKNDQYLVIRMVDYDGDTYIESRLPYSSCMGCNIFDCKGNRIDSPGFTTPQRLELVQAMNGDESIVLWGRTK